jgi:hypothetical protein
MRHTFGIIIALSVMLSAAAVHAQGESRETPDILKFIMSFEGSWTSDCTATMMGETMEMAYNCDFEVTPQGDGVVMYEVAEVEGMPAYTATNLVGYDYPSESLVWFTVDSEGHAHSHTAEIRDGNFFMYHDSEYEGMAYREEITLERISDTEVSFHLDVYLDGEEFQSIDGVFVPR